MRFRRVKKSFFVWSVFGILIFCRGAAHAVSPPPDVDYGLAVDEQQCGAGLVGEDIRVLNGNNIQVREDLRLSSPNRLGLTFQAAYNSRSAVPGALGYGWTHTYESSLDPAFDIEGESFVKIIDSTGRAAYFQEDTPGVYPGAFKERSFVKAEQGGYIWYALNGTLLYFSSSGALTWMEDETGNRLDLAYLDNRVHTVTDAASGRVITFHYNANGRLESISGPVTQAVPTGTWVTYGYDANQNLVSVTYADGSGKDYAYMDPSDVHNLTKERDKAGHILGRWTYDAEDRAISNFCGQCEQGKGVDVNYVSETQVDVTDAYWTVRSYTLGAVDERKRVTAVTGPAGAPYSDVHAVRWVYDAMMRLSEVEYDGGAVTQYQNYDDRGNPGTVILASGTPEQTIITYTYHPDMSVILSRTQASVLGGGDKVTIWDYDDDYDTTPNEAPKRNLSRIIELGFTKDSAGAVIPYAYITTYTYNSKGQVLTIDGPLPGAGDTTSFTYNPTTGDLVSLVRPLIGSTLLSEYDAAGMVGKVTDVNGQSRSFTYDGRGRITAITNQADGSSTTSVYNAAGLLETTTDEDGISRSFSYESNYGRLVRITDAQGNYIAYDYDTQGNRIEMSKHKPSGECMGIKRWSYQHPDMPGKLWQEINADDNYTEYGYDAAGNVSSVTDPLGNATAYGYDPLNRLISVIQPGSVTTTYAYDTHGNLTRITDAQGNQTQYSYDDMSRVLSTTSPDTGTVT
jgi:YD repeat-containing protein